MRNLNDFIRALGGIHNVLSGIAGKIDLIPVPGGGGSAEWTKLSSDSGDSVTTSGIEYSEGDYTDIEIYVYSSSAGTSGFPIRIAAGCIPATYENNGIYYSLSSGTQIYIYIWESDGKLNIKTGSGTIKVHVYAR